MLRSIKSIVAVGVITCVFFVVAVIMLNNVMGRTELNFEFFYEKAEEFNECYDGADTELAHEIYENGITSYDSKDLQKYMTQNFQTSCNSRFVISSDEQIKAMSNELIDSIDYKLLDAVYTASSNYYAILNMPQEYLFFAMNEEKTILVAYVVKPTEDEYIIEEIFQTEDVDDATLHIQYLLSFYNEEVT